MFGTSMNIFIVYQIIFKKKRFSTGEIVFHSLIL